MATLSATQRTELETRKARLVTQLASLNDALENASTEVDQYRFDSGEGSQQMKYRGLDEIQAAIDRTETKIRWIDERLAGAGLVNISLVRRR